MKINTEYHTRENVKIKVFDKDGKVVKLFKPNWFSKLTGLKIGRYVEELCAANMIVNGGLVAMGSGAFDGTYSTKFTYIAVGSSSTEAAATDTALGTELTANGMARALGSYSQTTTDITNDTKVLSKTFTAVTAASTIRETGVFSASTSGTMMNRYVLPSDITVAVGSSIQITHEFQVARAA